MNEKMYRTAKGKNKRRNRDRGKELEKGDREGDGVEGEDDRITVL